jgi:co-chaperonin GroES (HSP10)
MKNESGVYPRGNRVLVYPDEIVEDNALKNSTIHIPDSVKEKYQTAQASGVLVAVGADAWNHITNKVYRVIDGSLKLVEIHKRGYSEPFAKVGERVSYAKYSGRRFTGKDGKRYLVINDEDITTGLDLEVEMSDLDTRKPIEAQRPQAKQSER